MKAVHTFLEDIDQIENEKDRIIML